MRVVIEILFLSSRLLHSLWGNWTTPYHIFNILFHAIVSVLFFLICRKIVFGSSNTILSFNAALLFAMHPIHTEAVSKNKVVFSIRVKIVPLLFCTAIVVTFNLSLTIPLQILLSYFLSALKLLNLVATIQLNNKIGKMSGHFYYILLRKFSVISRFVVLWALLKFCQLAVSCWQFSSTRLVSMQN